MGTGRPSSLSGLRPAERVSRRVRIRHCGLAPARGAGGRGVGHSRVLLVSLCPDRSGRQPLTFARWLGPCGPAEECAQGTPGTSGATSHRTSHATARALSALDSLLPRAGTLDSVGSSSTDSDVILGLGPFPAAGLRLITESCT